MIAFLFNGMASSMLLIWFSSVLATAQIQDAQVVVSQRDLDSVAFVLAGMEDARSQVRSGVFRASGRLRSEHPVNGRSEGPVEIYCVFDHDRDILRFDREEPIDVVTRNRGTVKEIASSKFVRTPDSTIHWGGASAPRITLRPSGTPPTVAMRPFDVRALGIASLSALDHGDDYHTLLERVYRRAQVLDARVEDGVHRVTWLLNEGVRRTVWVDSNRGFTPLRFVQREANGPQDGDALSPLWGSETLNCDVSWSERQSVWLPIAISITLTGKNRQKAYDLSISWENVNQPIDDSLLTPEGLGLPDHTLIIDDRLGKSIILGQVARLKQATRARGSDARTWFVVANIAIIILLLSTLVVRRLRVRFATARNR